MTQYNSESFLVASYQVENFYCFIFEIIACCVEFKLILLMDCNIRKKYPQTTAYVEEYIGESITEWVVNGIAFLIEWILVLAVGYEIRKITSEDVQITKNVWPFVELFIVLSLCAFVYIIKCCCLKLCVKYWFQKVKEDIELERREESGAMENTKNGGIWKRILNSAHMALNRVVIGAVGYEIKKQIFSTKILQWDTWDYVEITLVVLFCMWVLLFKYCVLKCVFLRYCCRKCFRKKEDNSDRSLETHNQTSTA